MRLESRLGLRLLHRTTRTVSLTFEGEQLYNRATRLLEDLRDMEAALSAQSAVPRGRVRVSLPATLGRMVVLPKLTEFCEKFPDIEVDVGLDDRKVDLVEGGYDLAIRTGSLEDSGLLARSLGKHRFVLCAAPAYIEKHGVPASIGQLESHSCIRFRYPSTGLLEKWSFDSIDMDSDLGRGPTLNDGEAIVVAAIAGLGLAQLPDYAVASALASMKLVSILPQWQCTRGDIWIIRPASREHIPRVAVFATFLEQCLEEFRLN